MTTRIAIIGFGKIAQDQHVPAIRGNAAFELVAVVGPRVKSGSAVPAFHTLAELLSAMPVDALAICTPPGPRHAIATEALAAGLHLLIEKPPTATLGEILDLKCAAAEAGRVLFTAWHSQQAAGVAAARAAIGGSAIARLRIDWFEDVRKWHPGQEWIWAPGGFGVFDPGINGLSIATAILPMPLLVTEAALAFPANKQAPIAASLRFAGGDWLAEMDWRHADGECWTIAIDTEDGRRILLSDGGARLCIDSVPQSLPEQGEYPALYARFAELLATGCSDVDSEPLRIVADAFLVGRRDMVEPFD